MAKRSLLSRCPSYIGVLRYDNVCCGKRLPIGLLGAGIRTIHLQGHYNTEHNNAVLAVGRISDISHILFKV